LKRFFCAILALILLGAVLMACNSGGGTPNQTPTSGVTKRVFASNSFRGVISIIDADQDRFASHFITVTGGQLREMALALDRSVTLVWNAAAQSVVVLNNSTEAQTASILMPNPATSFAAMNNATGFVAVRNSNQLVVLDISGNKIGETIALNTPTQVVLSHNGNKLLVFSDGLSDSIYVVDTATATTDPNNATTTVTSVDFDHPVYAVFTSDDSKAFILSCGPECGGTTARVTEVNMTTPPTPGPSVVLAGGATIGLLNSNTLYVAGNDNSFPPVGYLTPVTTNPLAAGTPVAIGDGYHWKIGLGSNNKLFIGAKNTCTLNRCLTVFDTGSNTASVEQQDPNDPNSTGFGNVTGIQPISGRDRVYLAQGSPPTGEIRIFDTTTGLPLPDSQQLDASGDIVDVLQVDP